MRIALLALIICFAVAAFKEIVLAMQEELIKRGHYVKIITPKPLDYDGKIPDTMIALGGAVKYQGVLLARYGNGLFLLILALV